MGRSLSAFLQCQANHLLHTYFFLSQVLCLFEGKRWPELLIPVSLTFRMLGLFSISSLCFRSPHNHLPVWLLYFFFSLLHQTNMQHYAHYRLTDSCFPPLLLIKIKFCYRYFKVCLVSSLSISLSLGSIIIIFFFTI